MSLPTPIDRSHDILKYNPSFLEALFSPKTIAVIGSSTPENSIGATLIANITTSGFKGKVFSVNPGNYGIDDNQSISSIGQIKSKIDLAIITTPGVSLLQIFAECNQAEVKAALVTSPIEQQLQKQLFKSKGKMRLIGPNSIGVINPWNHLNASLIPQMPLAGHVGLISQSGALSSSILDWSLTQNVGFSSFVSLSCLWDVDWGDLIYHFGDDPHTNSIIIYMESIGNARSFLSAAREVALSKPIIVMKSGRTPDGAHAASSHTGALVGNDEIYNTAFRRTGVLRVDTIEELFNMAELLDKQPRPKGKRLTIVTNSGGAGVIATDALIQGKGELAQLSPQTLATLQNLLPSLDNNPIDLQGDEIGDRIAQILQTAKSDPNTDALLVILTPQHGSDTTAIAHKIQEIAQTWKDKPLFSCFMGGNQATEAEKILNKANIYTCSYPDMAARLFNLMWQYSYNLRGLYQTPVLPQESNENPPLAKQLITQIRNSGRTLLSAIESKELLNSYGIPIITGAIATTSTQAIEEANKIGYPVVLKLHSHTITHKSRVGGVRLNLITPEAVKNAYDEIQQNVVTQADFLGVSVEPMCLSLGYELIIGSSVDPQFGPVLLFGLGGRNVEVFKDQALALPPLNTTLALRLMEQTHIYQALHEFSLELQELLVRFSQLVVENPQIKEIEINPLLVSNKEIVALDARVILYDKNVTAAELPPLAIRPYPIQYLTPCTFKNSQQGIIRPIRPEDEPLIVKFHQQLSEESVYLRYFHLIKLQTRISHDRLARVCFIDYDQEMALVAETLSQATSEPEIIGVARLTRLHENNQEAEFALLVSDRHQGKGLGTLLLQNLLKVAKQENIEYITAEILTENRVMQHLCKKLGFVMQREIDLVKAIYKV